MSAELPHQISKVKDLFNPAFYRSDRFIYSVLTAAAAGLTFVSLYSSNVFPEIRLHGQSTTPPFGTDSEIANPLRFDRLSLINDSYGYQDGILHSSHFK